jgi:hypothetical protein
MQSATRRPESPAGNGMMIVHSLPTDHNGKTLDGGAPSILTVVPSVNGHVGSATTNVTPGKLSRAGMLAMLAAVNTYLSGLSAANADLIHGGVSGGLSITITPTQVVVPVAPAGAATLAASMATVLTTAGNVVTG